MRRHAGLFLERVRIQRLSADMTRVALTGGTGFIGANLARALLRRGNEVHLLNRATHTTWRIERIRRDVALHVVDLADASSVRAAFRTIRPELVFHLAQVGGYAWQTDVGAMVATNYLACINLLQAAKEFSARVVVNTGSSSEYGLKSHPTREIDCLEPNSDYAATKAAGTLYCRQWARREGRPVPTLRLYSVYGPFEEPMRLLPRLVSFGLEGRLPPLADPDTARDFVYVDDAVAALLRAAETSFADPGDDIQHLLRPANHPAGDCRSGAPHSRRRDRAVLEFNAIPCVGYRHVGRQSATRGD